jgi:hypothetical protein
MRALFCAAALTLCVVPGGYSETRTPSFPVTIVYRFDGPTSAVAFGEMEDEIQAVMGSTSLRPEWRNRAEVTSSDRFEKLVVVDFHGRCRTGPGGSMGKEDQPLGWAQVADGKVLPFIEIECGRVQASLPSTLWRQNQTSDLTLGRALARVLAHELYHVLAGTTSHSRSGIAKPALSGYDLTSSRLVFTPAEVDRMMSAQEPPSVVRVARGGPEFVQ